MSTLRRPWLKEYTSKTLGRKFRINVYDQPGYWMSHRKLTMLHWDIEYIARNTMDQMPTYGIFEGSREKYKNRIIGVAYDVKSGLPVAFTAMVYFPMVVGGSPDVVIHAGLTMVSKEYRGKNLQSRIFSKLLLLPMLNQFRTSFIITNIAASPAGIGSLSDYFQDTYPHYAGTTQAKGYHLEVARQALDNYRDEFGCSKAAVFDEKTFVVSGSNNLFGGGAYQFIKTDPVSRYKPECMEFCDRTLMYERGDELFQVGKLDLFETLKHMMSRMLKRK